LIYLLNTATLFKPGMHIDLEYADSLNITQLIDISTRINPRDHSKSTLLDVIFTNIPHKYTPTAVFCSDVSDHHVIACIRDTKLPKLEPCYAFKRFF